MSRCYGIREILTIMTPKLRSHVIRYYVKQPLFRNVPKIVLLVSFSVANLMNLARSPVVRNCGLNMEYTFHLLCKFQGDFEMTLRALLHESFTIFDRVYSGKLSLP